MFVSTLTPKLGVINKTDPLCHEAHEWKWSSWWWHVCYLLNNISTFLKLQYKN